jgi:hypothetical protein
MSVIPEVTLQRAIVNGYRALRKDPRLLDALFRNLSQEQLSSVKQFILDSSVQFSINYPREDLKVPSLVLILKNETESTPFLGDEMTTLVTPDPDITYDTLGGHGASISDSKGLTRKLAGPLEVESSDDSTLTFAEDATTIVESLIEDPVGCALLYVVGGTGAGQVHTVLRMRSDALDIVEIFDPHLDSTSLVDIRVIDDSEMALGEPSRVYDADNRINLRRRGAQYETTYHLHVIAGHQDEVIFLYSVIKALLLSQRVLLESQGIIALRISGSDFAPRTEYLPSEVFQRMMVLTFTYPFDFIEELNLPDQLVINVSPTDPQTGESGETVIGVTIDL